MAKPQKSNSNIFSGMYGGESQNKRYYVNKPLAEHDLKNGVITQPQLDAINQKYSNMPKRKKISNKRMLIKKITYNYFR